MGGLPELANELTRQIFNQLETPIDILNLGRCNKLLYALARPYLLGTTSFYLPNQDMNGEWDNSVFSKIPDLWRQSIRKIVVERAPFGYSLSPGPGQVFIQVISKDNDKPMDEGIPRYEYALDRYEGQIAFSSYLRHFILNLKPGQLQEFEFGEYFYEAVRDRKSINQVMFALSDPQSRLTKLEMQFYAPLEYDCATLHLPHLKKFEYECLSDSGYHAIFTILYGCQENLEELICRDTCVYDLEATSDEDLETNEAPPPNPIWLGYESWEHCVKCCQKLTIWDADEKGIFFPKLTTWQTSTHLMKVFYQKNILQSFRLQTLRLEESVDIYSKNATINPTALASCPLTYPEFENDYHDFFKSHSGFVSLGIFMGGDEPFKSSYWLKGLAEAHYETLMELDISPNFCIKEHELEYLGNGLPKLKKLMMSVEFDEKSFPTLLLDGRIFPELRFFESTYSYTPEYKPTLEYWERNLCEAIQQYAKDGVLSKNLDAILLGADFDYGEAFLFLLERGYTHDANGGSTGSKFDFIPVSAHPLAGNLAQVGIKLRSAPSLDFLDQENWQTVNHRAVDFILKNRRMIAYYSPSRYRPSTSKYDADSLEALWGG
ncbi:hypothetical protein AA313_de0204372 [Arthrobotrys entomopaga]|nr:hypothetical protein AA313_de0204372 [Arthrobotrys entomopaga]